jgi:chromosome segregation ATPase
MTKDNKNKSMSWFKGGRSNQHQLSQNEIEANEASTDLIEEYSNMEDSTPLESTSKKYILSKENQDKLSMDLIVSIENVLNDRQLMLYKNDGLEDQLHTANETISRLKHDLVKKEQLVQDKNKEIRTLESNLTNKQMAYDQLLEDYKEYQNTSSNDFEKVSVQLEKETNKYNMLKEESTNIQYQNMLTIRELEERIRELEVENQKSSEQYIKVLDEKDELMKTINDFTERMSFSFSSKTAANKE